MRPIAQHFPVSTANFQDPRVTLLVTSGAGFGAANLIGRRLGNIAAQASMA